MTTVNLFGGMMDFALLRFYPVLSSVLTENYKAILIKNIPAPVSDRTDYLVNIYSSFVDIINTSPPHFYNYSGLDILNDEKKFFHHYRCFIGFLYSETNMKLNTIVPISFHLSQTLYSVALDKGMNILPIAVSIKFLTDDVLECIELYRKLTINKKKLSYYNGWSVFDKSGQEIKLHHAKVYDCYGSEFTNQIHEAFKVYAKTHKKGTATNLSIYLRLLLHDFITLEPDLNKLKVCLQPNNSMFFFAKILNINIARKVQNGHSVKWFLHIGWVGALRVYEKCLVEGKVFEEPLRSLLSPRYKFNKSQSSISSGGGYRVKSKKRLLTNIPLSIKDEEAIEFIVDRVKRDIQHLRLVTQHLIDEINERQLRNIQFINTGEIKPLKGGKRLGVKVQEGKQLFPIGTDHLANTYATFNKYRFSKKAGYVIFLGCKNKAEFLMKELNLPTLETILPYLIQLILEHPKLTPSWFIKWELFNKSGTQVGFIKSGKQHLIISNKDRKGSANAEQAIVLTEHSKYIVESLIEHTDLIREELKKQGNNDWRYTIICMKSLTSQPKCLKELRGGFLKKFQQNIAIESHDSKGRVILSKHEADELAILTNLRSARSTRALLVYLETHSVKAMSEALGHKSYNPNLLSCYLPDVLLEYFNSRWIRIFQNAIIYEATKNKPYLFDAIDITPEQLEEFLINHQLETIPDSINTAKKIVTNNEKNIPPKFEQLVITLSIPLLLLLIAIQAIVKLAEDDDYLPEVLGKWYETSVLIIKQLSLTGKGERFGQSMKSILPLFEQAKKHPLDVDKLKDSLCR